MAKIIWSKEALLDLDGIYDYIARDSYLYARYQSEKILNSVERLCLFPESGRNIPEYPQLPYREIIVNNYRVIYRYDHDKNEIHVIAIVHGSRLLKTTFLR